MQVLPRLTVLPRLDAYVYSLVLPPYVSVKTREQSGREVLLTNIQDEGVDERCVVTGA